MRCWVIILNPVVQQQPQVRPDPLRGLDGREPLPMAQARMAMLELSSKQKPSYIYFDKEAAYNAAEEKAKENPQTPIYIFEAVAVRETQEAPIMKKLFNSSGELLPE